MIKFPNIGKQPEPPQKKMTPKEYLRFCDFCRRNNPHGKAEEKDVKIPFKL